MGLFTRRKPKVDYGARIAELTRENESSRSLDRDRELRDLRHRAGIEAIVSPPARPALVEPAAAAPARGPESKCPEVTPEELTPEVLRAAILEAGCLLVRDLVPDEEALAFADGIERAFATRLSLRETGGEDGEGFYDELDPEPPYEVQKRDWIEEGGGVLAVDSPRLLSDMLSAFEKVSLPQVIESYLGEKPLISADKCTLRKATPDVPGAWHQDGRFMGDVRAMNVWLSLSRCGDEAPGMDLVPTRLDDFVATGTEGTWLETQVSDAVAEEAAGEIGIVRPVFNPGDALLFDDLFLHQTGSDPNMPNPRYAIESWFFGASAFPEIYVPLAA
ncbi:MAG: hypothetical protein KDB52_10400 [Solirubrobacterales bacterium]|nr:hypothetical protein [Solirubrobacterales bacterium]